MVKSWRFIWGRRAKIERGLERAWVLHPPLEGEGRPRPAMRSIVRSGRCGVTVSHLEHCPGREITPPRLSSRFARCEPTLPLQGRVSLRRTSRTMLSTYVMGNSTRSLLPSALPHRLEAPGQNALLHMQAVLGLVEHHRLRAVDHLVGD